MLLQKIREFIGLSSEQFDLLNKEIEVLKEEKEELALKIIEMKTQADEFQNEITHLKIELAEALEKLKDEDN